MNSRLRPDASHNILVGSSSQPQNLPEREGERAQSLSSMHNARAIGNTSGIWSGIKLQDDEGSSKRYKLICHSQLRQLQCMKTDADGQSVRGGATYAQSSKLLSRRQFDVRHSAEAMDSRRGNQFF
jgi:hypothetical protein